MLKPDTNSLKKARKLVRSGKLDKARPILTDLLKREESNEQAWFLLSQTLSDREKKEYALKQALRINPDFEKAKEQLQQLDEGITPPGEEPEETEPAPLDELEKLALESLGDEKEPESFIPPAEKTFFDEELSSPEETISSPEEPGSRKRRVVVLGSLVIVTLLILALVLSRDWIMDTLSSFGDSQPISTATEIQGFRTLPPTWTPSGIQTPQP